MQAGAEWQNHDLVFTDEYGAPIKQHLLRKSLRVALERVELPMIKSYALRHSCATILLTKGVITKVIADRLSHSSVKTTLDTYTQVVPGQQEQATEKLEKAVFSGVSTISTQSAMKIEKNANCKTGNVL